MICGVIKLYILLKFKILLLLRLCFIFFAIYLLLNSLFISIKIPFLSIFFTQFNLSFLIDWISISFLATVILISAIIIKFRLNYIPSKEHNFFSNLIIIFILSINLLIISDNIIFIILGWDGLGLSSYILVVYYQNFSSASSGTITILSNRIGDITILLSISLLFCIINWNFYINFSFPKIVLILLIIAAISKSAQFPFSAWLPAAISAPTPISALVHSSTLVTAGVYLIIRINNIFHPIIILILIIISSITALYARLSALWEQDLKKIIALSTLSQIAIIIFAISLNSLNRAFFHLISHALFKSIIFLCAGVIIHNFIYQDIRFIRSIFFYSPITISILGISNISLIGIPFISGFFSKDSIIEKIINSYSLSIITILIIFSISLTSIYSIRKIFYSSKFLFKYKIDLNFSTHTHIENSIIYIRLFPISLGIIISWIILPQQNFIIPNSIKLSILISLFFGIIIPLLFSPNNKNFLKFGQSAITLWFSHFLTARIIIPSNLLIINYQINDKSWKEIYGPQNIFLYYKKFSKTPDIINFSLISLLIIISIIPIIFLY